MIVDLLDMLGYMWNIGM